MGRRNRLRIQAIREGREQPRAQPKTPLADSVIPRRPSGRMGASAILAAMSVVNGQGSQRVLIIDDPRPEILRRQ